MKQRASVSASAKLQEPPFTGGETTEVRDITTVSACLWSLGISHGWNRFQEQLVCQETSASSLEVMMNQYWLRLHDLSPL